MSFKLRDIRIAVELPQWPRSLPIFNVQVASLRDRQGAIDILRENMELGDTLAIEAQESIHFVSERGEIQYYRPSGALWVHDGQADARYEDERRPWKTVEARDPDDPENVQLVLAEEEQQALKERTERLFRDTGLLSEEAYFAGVELDQVARLDEKGRELQRFAGEANVKFLYRLDKYRVDGPGAKSYAFYNPGERAHELTGLYHAWRTVRGRADIEMHDPAETLERVLTRDPELVLYHDKHGSVITITQAELVYFTLPPVKFQDWVFPALHVVGSVVGREKREDGFEFARFYNAGAPNAYLKANVVAGYMLTRL